MGFIEIRLKGKSIMTFFLTVFFIIMPKVTAAAAAARFALVTGSTDGIGRHTASRLACEGYHVFLHGRSQQRLEEARAAILVKKADASIDLLCHDLITIQGAKDLAADVASRTDKLDILINNAGVFQEEKIVTPDGLESTFAINVAATFILNSLLLPLLRNAFQSRVLNVSSISQSDIGRVNDFSNSNLQFEKTSFSSYNSYSLSKLCVAMISHEMAKRIPSSDTLVISCDPGTVNTKMLLAGWGMCGIKISDANDEFKLVTAPFDESMHGRYYVSCRESRCSADVYDDSKREELWRRLEEICGLTIE